jgi:hypothetical protein
MALTSPGVEVKVIDESFYTPAAPGTVPLIFVASAENKLNGAGDGVAPGTLKANAGQVYLITSQKDLVDTFGDPLFRTDANNNPIHAGEQNEYGLQAAYSLLGVSNRAFVVRADLDLNQLNPSTESPAADPANGTHWLDTQTTNWGIFEWDARPATAGGQKFVNKIPLVITDVTKIDALTEGPVASVGKNGTYAVVAVDVDPDTSALTSSHPLTLWYKNSDGMWVRVGTDAWAAETLSLAIAPHTQVPQWKVAAENAATGSVWIKTTEPNLGARWRVKRYNGNTDAFETIDSPIYGGTQEATYGLDKTGGGAKLAVGTLYVDWNRDPSTDIDFTGAVSFKLYRRRAAAPTQIRTAKITADTFEATGQGTLTKLSPVLVSGVSAGSRTVTIESSVIDDSNPLNPTPYTASVTVVTTPQLGVSITINSGAGIFEIGELITIPGSAIGGIDEEDDFVVNVSSVSKSYSFEMAESVAGSQTLAEEKTVSFTVDNASAADAAVISAAINAAGFVNVEASVDSQNRLVIAHEIGGEIHFIDGTNDPLQKLGFEQFNPTTGAGLVNLYNDADGEHDFVATLWEPLVYVASEDAPTSLTVDGRLWYSSVVDEVDVMIHNGSTWVGYLNYAHDESVGPNATDALGPFVTASAPTTQRDGSALETGDLWISTDDIENFPMIYKYNKDLQKWILVDNADQSTEDGILFADARYNTAGANSDQAGDIGELLTSNYLDFDAPDPALYPKGMLLWNLRRSGFNVKEFRQNYIDVNADNVRYKSSFNDIGQSPTSGDAMADYYPHRWVTVSQNDVDGAGSFGRKAQRKVVVQALQALANSNNDIRDDEGRIFNLIACPGYPELIGEMISLNYDRGLTAFVVGDTPARLTPDATSLLRWGTNQALAVEDNDIGAASYDEYMGMFYPWGFTSDNFGNNVVIPPSHMILRTIALNDQVAYPWFAPAGLRRGGITNATAVGYVDKQEGEFRTVALNNGQRDTLYEAKINPITFFTGSGLVNYGQKTRAKAASALDRINVARLVIYLRRQLSLLAKPYVFEPNDKITRDEIKAAVESLLLELVGQRALYDYLVVCDESNNTPSRIDRNELWIDIAIEPVKAIEFIYIPLRLKNTGEISGL